MAFGVGPTVSLPDEDLSALWAVTKRPKIFFRTQRPKPKPMPPGTTIRINPATGRPEVVAGAGGRGSLLGKSAMQLQAEQVAAGILDPQIAAITRAADLAERNAAARAEAAKGIIGAVGSYSEGLPEAVRKAYATAGQDISGYASALGGDARAAASSAAAEVAAQLAAQHAPGGVESQAGAYADTNQYVQGFIPGRDLAEEAASRLLQAGTLRTAAGAALGQQALAMSQEEQDAIDELRMKGLDVELTRPGEIAKAMDELRKQGLDERQIAIQERALQVQIGQLQLSQVKTVWDQALALTNMTGTLHVARNGKIVNTGKPASGSEAAQMVAAAKASAASAANTRASNLQTKANQLTNQTGKLHVVRNGKVVNTGRKAPGSTAAANAQTRANQRVSQGLAKANLELSRERLELAKQAEARLAKGGGSGGFTPYQINNFRGLTRGIVDFVVTKGKTPKEALRLAMLKHVPFSIAIKVIQTAARERAELKDDPLWQATLGWTK